LETFCSFFDHCKLSYSHGGLNRTQKEN
jgi:hypothetical protein